MNREFDGLLKKKNDVVVINDDSNYVIDCNLQIICGSEMLHAIFENE